MLNIVLIISLISFPNSIGHSDKPQSLKVQRFTASIFSPYSLDSSCDWLGRLKHQKKQCSQRKGLPAVLQEARHLAVRHCETRFKYDQWNCSAKDNLSKRINRESAFMQAISVSAVCYAVAKACSEGKLGDCKCGEHGKSQPGDAFKWGGCGYNAKFARRFTRKFLQLKKVDDLPSFVMKNNAEVGLRAALVPYEPKCKCHGVSGSCSLKICWKQLRPFNLTSEHLKTMYHKAVKLHEQNNYRLTNKNKRNSRKLLYLEDSPNFCPRTVHRQCRNKDNCATLCCGRGYYSENIREVEQCNCSWRNKTFDVACHNCTVYKTILLCS